MHGEAPTTSSEGELHVIGGGAVAWHVHGLTLIYRSHRMRTSGDANPRPESAILPV